MIEKQIIINTILLDEYRTLLHNISQNTNGEYKPFIAGGAMRDMFVGKPIKDIDVFYYGNINKKFIEQYFPKKKSLTLFDEFMEMFGGHNPYEDADFHVTHPRLFHKDFDVPIQLIQIKDDMLMEEYIETFGCNLSKAGFTELGGPYAPASFWNDFDNNQLTFTDDCTPSYVQRMKEKFPEYTVVGKKKIRFLNRATA